ncbi:MULTISPECIES: hypothetical protein [Nocardia]|uniref:hypothetical protein n=1 Tax=Nocardia TaxID=1817 RepID=UPI002455A426|nr:MULTISPECIES: hypothetical protein [Nocardia]
MTTTVYVDLHCSQCGGVICQVSPPLPSVAIRCNGCRANPSVAVVNTGEKLRRRAVLRRVHDDEDQGDGAPPSPVQFEAWADAARHIFSDGLLPILPIEALRELWRRGGADRQLALICGQWAKPD